MPLSKQQYRKLKDEYDKWYKPLDYGIFTLLTKEIRRQKYLNLRQLWQVAFWKVGSSRNDDRIFKNDKKEVARITKRALSRERSDDKRIDDLCNLEGVSVPIASAILTVWNPRRYCIIDKYVWKTYCNLTGSKKKTYNSKSSYHEFLGFCRAERNRIGKEWTVRDIEKSLYMYSE